MLEPLGPGGVPDEDGQHHVEDLFPLGGADLHAGVAGGLVVVAQGADGDLADLGGGNGVFLKDLGPGHVDQVGGEVLLSVVDLGPAELLHVPAEEGVGDVVLLLQIVLEHLHIEQQVHIDVGVGHGAASLRLPMDFPTIIPQLPGQRNG